jgi:hypothetical protein
MDGTYEPMPVVSWTTAGLMNNMMAKRLGIKNPEAFALYEITPEGGDINHPGLCLTAHILTTLLCCCLFALCAVVWVPLVCVPAWCHVLFFAVVPVIVAGSLRRFRSIQQFPCPLLRC